MRQLTSGPAADFFPAVSPDGSAIASQSNRSGSQAIWTMSADGSIKGQLTPDSLNGGKPNWAPNGKKIVFENNGCNTCSSSDVFVINANGAGLVRLTSDFGNNIEAVWSPDGKKIAFSHNEGPTPDFFQPEDIYVMNANGTGIMNVTQSPAVDDCCPGWRPQ